MVGSALACGLATAPALQGCKIAIVEVAPPKSFEEVVNMVRWQRCLYNPCLVIAIGRFVISDIIVMTQELPDLRVFAISPSNVDFFKVIRAFKCFVFVGRSKLKRERFCSIFHICLL